MDWRSFHWRYDRPSRRLLLVAAVGTAVAVAVAIGNLFVPRLALLEVFLLATVISLVPLALSVLRPPDTEPAVLLDLSMRMYPAAAVAGAVAIALPHGPLAAFLAVPWLLATGLASLDGLARFIHRGLAVPEELAIDFGLMYLPMAGFWFVAYRLGTQPLGVPDLIVLLAAVHFTHAGFTALLLTGLTGRWLMARGERVVTIPLWFTAAAGLVCPTAVAFGIAFHWRWLELGSAIGMELGYLVLAVVALWRVTLRQSSPAANALLTASAIALLVGVGFAATYTAQWLDIPQMARTHGWIMLVAVCGCGLTGWLLAGPVAARAAEPHTYLIETSRELTFAAYAVFVGQMLFTAALVPVWKALPPSQFLAWFKTNMPVINQPLEALGAVVGAGGLLCMWLIRGDRAAWRRAALATACWMLMIATTIVFLGAANSQLAGGAIDSAEVAGVLNAWGRWHWTRLAFGVVGLAVFLPLLGGNARPGPLVVTARPEWVTTIGYASALLLGVLTGVCFLEALLALSWSRIDATQFLSLYAVAAPRTDWLLTWLTVLSGLVAMTSFVGSLARPWRDAFWFAGAAGGWLAAAALSPLFFWSAGRFFLDSHGVASTEVVARLAQWHTWTWLRLAAAAGAAYAASRALRPPDAVPEPEPLPVLERVGSIDGQWSSVQDAVTALIGWERRLCHARDRRGVFAITYSVMLRRLHRQLEKGEFEDPAWVVGFAVRLAVRYDDAMRRWESNDPSLADCWRIALDSAGSSAGSALLDLLLAMNAHLYYDHAMALVGDAQAELEGYRADYERLMDALRASVHDSAARIGEVYAPGIRIVSRLLGPVVRIVVGRSIASRREAAWRWAVAIQHADNSHERERLTHKLAEEVATRVRSMAETVVNRPLMFRALRAVEDMNGVALPPGGLGLPWLGQSLMFAKDPAGFLETRFRQYGPAFKLRLLGSNTIALVGPDAFSLLTDESRFRRERANPQQWRELMDWECTPLIDGPRRLRRKRLVLQAFAPDAIRDYLAIIDKVLAAYLERWSQLREFRWTDELKDYSFAVAEALYLGAPAGVRARRDRETLDRCYRGMSAVPIDLPFTTFGRAVRARDTIIDAITRAAVDHRSDPQPDLMQRLLAARDEEGGLSMHEIQMEVVQMFYASYGAIYAVLSCVAIALGTFSAVARRAREEIMHVAPDGRLSLDILNAMPYVDRFTREVRRYYPLVATTLFAEATADSAFDGHLVPRGWKVIGCIASTLLDERTFPEPDAFDPDRFLPERFRQLPPNSWVPHGGGTQQGHRCAGEALADAHLKLFVARLLRDYVWEIPKQDVSLDPSEGIPVPRDRLHVIFQSLTNAPDSRAYAARVAAARVAPTELSAS